MQVDINLLKRLREVTFAPIKDCKDALIQAEWDFDKAQDILKEKWISKAWKKADRETNDGIVKVRREWDKNIWIKLACETDFVSRNENFHELANKIIDVLSAYNWELSALSDIDQSFLDEKIIPIIQENIWKIGENIRLLDAFIKNWKSYVYAHPWDKVVAIIYYDGSDENIAKEVALQVAAMNPDYLDVDSVPANVSAEMKAKFAEEMAGTNKPADMVEKIVEWKLMKSYSDFVLLEQLYIRDDTKKIKHILPEWFKVLSFVRFSI